MNKEDLQRELRFNIIITALLVGSFIICCLILNFAKSMSTSTKFLWGCFAFCIFFEPLFLVWSKSTVIKDLREEKLKMQQQLNKKRNKKEVHTKTQVSNTTDEQNNGEMNLF